MVYSKQGPIIAVMGATGMQGGSVIRALLQSKQPYQIRALTRNPSSSAAAALDSSIQVVAADANDAASLVPAFANAKYVFGMTNFWEAQGDAETVNGKRIVDAAKEAKVELLLWSGLPDVNTISGGKYTAVAHFDNKAKVFEYAKNSGVPTISVEPGFYAANLLKDMAPRKQPNGVYAIALPGSHADTKVAIIDAEHDFGLYVQEALESGAFKAGSRVLAASEIITIGTMMEQWSSVTGEKSFVAPLPREVYTTFFPTPELGEEFAQMFDYFADYSYFNGEDIAPSQAHLSRPARKWVDFVKAADWSAVIQ